jgi:CubicO group peptidase (beta-lactamase class C family)
MAKLGQLVLSGGVWDGTRLLTEDWIDRSTAWVVETGEMLEGYGYLWWKTRVAGPTKERLDVTVANGWGSQFIFIVPALDLVLVTTGGNDYNGKHIAVKRLLATLIRSGVGPLPAG